MGARRLSSRGLDRRTRSRQQRVLTPSELLTAADYELPRTDDPCLLRPVHDHDEESEEVKEIFAGDYYQITEQKWDVENRIELFHDRTE
jgi:hypothetical protein